MILLIYFHFHSGFPFFILLRLDSHSIFFSTSSLEVQLSSCLSFRCISCLFSLLSCQSRSWQTIEVDICINSSCFFIPSVPLRCLFSRNMFLVVNVFLLQYSWKTNVSFIAPLFCLLSASIIISQNLTNMTTTNHKMMQQQP
jgi:hypothetical protein